MTMHSPTNDPIERILTEIAIRIQLPPSKHELACQRYMSVANYLERDGSELKDKISRFYPQGSMAIDATIAARGKEEEYDIDIIAELLLPNDCNPEYVLDLLYREIKGDLGSMYYKKVKRRTRCVTIYYEDGMHMDITPAILRLERQERTSDIFHDDPDIPSEPSESLLMNAWGFSELFKLNTKDTTEFSESYARDSKAYEFSQKADTEEVEPQENLVRKSSDVVALQLIKRFRNTQYANRDVSMPPSVLISKYVNDAANPMDSLVKALAYHVTYIQRQLSIAESNNRLVYEVNPACAEDCFTDRWPQNRSDQRLFLNDLKSFQNAFTKIDSEDLSVAEIQELLVGVFGDYPTKAAVRTIQKIVGKATQSGSTLHKVGGGLLLGVTKSSTARPAPVNTNMGGALIE